MNQSDKTSVLNRSPLARLFGWLFSGSGLRCVLILLVCAVALVLSFYAEEGLRGRYQWNKYRRQLEAGGEQLDLKAFIPKLLPADENFAATPLVESWFRRGSPPLGAASLADDDYSAASEMVSAPDKDKGDRHFLDLVAWGRAFEAVRSGLPRAHQKFASGEFDLQSRARSAPAVLDGLKSAEAALAELRSASQRPHCRYPVQYDLGNPWAILLPHLAKVKAASQRLQLRACAELAAGESNGALKDVELMLYLADSLKDESFLISHLVRIACVQIASQPVWEGLAEHRWSDAQLQALQTRFQQFDFLADMKRALEAEQAAGILTIDLVRKNGLGYLASLQGSESPPPAARAVANALGWFVPSGWYDLEKLNYCRLRHTLAGTALDTTKRRVSPSQVAANTREFERVIESRGILGHDVSAILQHRLTAGILLPAIGKVSLRAAAAQTTTDEAVLGCALERYRLANGEFPGTLEALVSRFISSLPNDVLTGEPYRYSRTDDGQFTLYSVGWNEKDDGGVPGKIQSDDKLGDWVWHYPAK